VRPLYNDLHLYCGEEGSFIVLPLTQNAFVGIAVTDVIRSSYANETFAPNALTAYLGYIDNIIISSSLIFTHPLLRKRATSTKYKHM